MFLTPTIRHLSLTSQLSIASRLDAANPHADSVPRSRLTKKRNLPFPSYQPQNPLELGRLNSPNKGVKRLDTIGLLISFCYNASLGTVIK